MTQKTTKHAKYTKGSSSGSASSGSKKGDVPMRYEMIEPASRPRDAAVSPRIEKPFRNMSIRTTKIPSSAATVISETAD